MSFPEPSALPSQAALPDPLVMFDGRRVSSTNQWFRERRPELKALFQHYMYGAIPPKPAHVQTKVLGEYHDFLAGKATLKLLTLETGPTNAPRIDLMLVVPNARRGPAPVFLVMDFCGNHALTHDPRVPLARTWLGSSCKGCLNNTATEAARGSQDAVHQECRRCLAIGSSDADDPQLGVRMAEEITAGGCEGAANLLHLNPARGQSSRSFALGDDRHRAALLGRPHIEVTVGLFPGDGKERSPRLNLARIVGK